MRAQPLRRQQPRGQRPSNGSNPAVRSVLRHAAGGRSASGRGLGTPTAGLPVSSARRFEPLRAADWTPDGGGLFAGQDSSEDWREVPQSERNRSLRALFSDRARRGASTHRLRASGRADPGGSERFFRRAHGEARRAFAAAFGQQLTREQRVEPAAREPGLRARSKRQGRGISSGIRCLGTSHRNRWSQAQGSSERNSVATPGEATDFAMEQSPEAEGSSKAKPNWRACTLGQPSGGRAQQREGNGRGDAERLSRREKLRRVYAPFGKARCRRPSFRREFEQRAGNVANLTAGSGVQ